MLNGTSEQAAGILLMLTLVSFLLKWGVFVSVLYLITQMFTGFLSRMLERLYLKIKLNRNK